MNISNIRVFVPVPRDADTPEFDTSVGTVSYVPEINSAVWKIASMAESREHTMVANFGLPSVRAGAPHLDTPLFPAVYTLSKNASRRARKDATDNCSIYYTEASDIGPPSEIPQGSRPSRIPGAPMGQIRDQKRRLTCTPVTNSTFFIPLISTSTEYIIRTSS